MNLIIILLLLASVFGYLYDEREGERRDNLPSPFGGWLRVAAAQSVGNSINSIFIPIESVVHGAGNEENIDQIENTMAAIDIDLHPTEGAPKDLFDLGQQTFDGSDIYRAMNSYKNLVNSRKQTLNDLDLSPVQNAFNSLLDLGHDTMDNVDFSAATDAFENVVKRGKQIMADMIPQTKIAIIPVEDLGELELLTPLAGIENGSCPPRVDLDILLNKAKDLLAVAFGIVLDFMKDLSLWIEMEYERIYDWTRENPKKAIAIGVVGVGITIMAAPGVVSGPALNIVGFGPNGVIAESLAAAVHGMIGNVAAGSSFAMLQSAGAGGSGLAVVNGVVQGAGLVITGYNVWDLVDELVKEQM
ncbi:hypothetical protein CkaCkLH20_11220 [Colletotrichum karsti]|uniref:Uncharacterized protein n=1 Tax=Colletotrichum karsti TaxID=1095194 RepID=A0A9P6HVT8_9PEZI|nr:uncharacterized protein CkaCkLH20_11220 [Colletotrichum karsti]KAF9871299.1 hypothetical protein CkaCkLH20_11220 [Colletotrichum karsti]